MEVTIIDTETPCCSGQKQTGTIGFTLVSELLGTVLGDCDEDILVEAESQGFMYDQGTGLKTGKKLTAGIEWGNIEGTEEKIEIRLSGTVENHLGQKDTYTLYFFMWWDRTSLSFSKKVYNFEETIGLKTILIIPEKGSERVSDSVFQLELYRNSLSGQCQFLGQGRGYLVFGRET